MRSTQRCSESFSCPEKYRRTISFVLPLLSPVVAPDLAFALGLALSILAFSGFGGSGFSVSEAVFSLRSSLNWSFLSSRKACLQRSSLWRASWAFSFSGPKAKNKKGFGINEGCDAGGDLVKKHRGGGSGLNQ